MVIGQGASMGSRRQAGSPELFSLPEVWLHAYVSGELEPAGGL
jgi:hypothetical protein